MGHQRVLPTVFYYTHTHAHAHAHTHIQEMDHGDDLTDSQLTLFMNMTQLEQSPITALSKADSPRPEATVGSQQSISTSRHPEGLHSTKGPPTPCTVQQTALSPVPVLKDSRRKSISPSGNATVLMFEDSGIGTMPNSNSASIRRASSPAPSPSCTTHPEPGKGKCHNAVLLEEAQLRGKKRTAECQSEPRSRKRRKDDNGKPLNNTFMHVTTVKGVARGCPIRPQGGTLYSIKRSCGRGRQPLSLLTHGLPPRQHTVRQVSVHS